MANGIRTGDPPVVSIKDVVRSSVKVPEFDKHMKKAGGLMYISRRYMGALIVFWKNTTSIVVYSIYEAVSCDEICAVFWESVSACKTLSITKEIYTYIEIIHKLLGYHHIWFQSNWLKKNWLYVSFCAEGMYVLEYEFDKSKYKNL